MKSIIAVLLALSLVFVFAACKNDIADDQNTEPVAEETGRPGSFVTNASGEVQTTARSYVVVDDNDKPVTEIFTDKEGSQKYQVVTTLVYDIATYPGATQTPTVAPGFTLADKGFNWPTYKFMEKVPMLSEKVSDTSYSKNEKGEVAIINLNDVSYAGYLEYIGKCKADGFEQTYGDNLPEKETDGESYIYYSIANGLYLSVSYNTNSVSYRNCDVVITVANYDVTDLDTAE